MNGIPPLRYYMPLIVVGDVFAVGVNILSLCERWNAPWWVFVPKALSLAALSGTVAATFFLLWRSWKLDREHNEWIARTRK